MYRRFRKAIKSLKRPVKSKPTQTYNNEEGC